MCPSATQTHGKTVIMGIGNLLMSDDGLGVHAARELMEMDLPGQVKVLDVGMAFLCSLNDIKDSERIIIIDAMKASGKPGTIYRSTLGDCGRPGRMDSLHNFDVFSMLYLAQNEHPNTVTVFGVEPAHIGWGMELSEEVSEMLPLLLEKVIEEIGAGQ